MSESVDATSERKSMLTAHLLWLFFGLVGAHRFYLGKKESAWWMVVLFAVVLFGPAKIFVAAALLLWWVADGILLAPWVRRANGENEEWAR